MNWADPRGRRSPSIRRKLVQIITTTSVVALGLAAGAFFAETWYSGRRSASEDLGATMAVIAENSVAAVAFDDPGAATEASAAPTSSRSSPRLCSSPILSFTCMFIS